MNKADIFILCVEDDSVPEEVLAQFKNEIKIDGLSVVFEKRQPLGPMACLEWFVVPAVLVYIAKSYFDGFLGEMGKEHFQSLKKSLSELSSSVMKSPRIEPTLIGTEGKLTGNNPYSLAFSIMADAERGYKFKLLVPKATSESGCKLITNRFMEFLADYGSGLQDLESIGCAWPGTHPPSNTIFVHYNVDKDAIEWLDERKFR